VTESEPAPPEVSVVIPSFQRRGALERLLRALEGQTLSASRFEVVVAIDGSSDGTKEMLESFRAPYQLRWAWQPNGGRAAACNTALRRARGDIVVILDDDMEPSPGLLDAHRREHPPGSRRCVMGAVPITVGDGASPHVRYVATKFDEHLASLARADHRFQIRDFYSGNTSVRRDELLAAGLFDDRFRAYGNEDLELAHRLAASGVELGFSPQAMARQHYDKSLRALAKDELAKGHTAVLFAEAHPDALRGMKITALREQPARRRALRRVLLWATRVFWRVPDVVLGAVAVGERLVPNRSQLIHRFALEYFYVLGVEQEMRARAAQSPPAAARTG
jgi:glycosyltransferase involved in cell wall biosynthesis